MLLSDAKIRELINNNVLQNANEHNIGPVSYDLTTKAFHSKSGEKSYADLMPGDSIFVSSEEIINLPDDLAARVSLRNSRIRQGLTLDAPLYFPGHKTRVFFRVTNVSSDEIKLNTTKGIAQLSFEEISGTVEKPYHGTFSDEFDYSGMGNYTDIYKSEMEEIDRREDSLKKMESRIYERVIALFAIFAAIFTLVNINAGSLIGNTSGITIATVNLSIIGGFSALVGLIAIALKAEGIASKIILFIIAVIAFIGAYCISL